MVSVLVVGAGFAGAVHARELADAGINVDVIDKRDHVGGNCFDYEHECGVRVHRYGPHLFHTSNRRVVDWLSSFTEWLPYEHRVVARLPDGRLVPAPINRDTVNAVFGTTFATSEEVINFLEAQAIHRAPIINAEDYLFSRIGPKLTNLFFRPYTRKMWDMDLCEVDADIVRRLQIRTDTENRYFPNDTFQAVPKDGYTKLFERIFDHPRISVSLNTAFSRSITHNYDMCFNSMPIDEFYDFEFGELPYRSIRFHITEIAANSAEPRVVINYTNTSPYTRETWWHNIPGHHISPGMSVLKTVEEPCSYRDNNFERYYPIKTADGRYERLHRRYAEHASTLSRMHFIGRCGTYQYLDMHQVINQSLIHVHEWMNDFGIR